MSISSVSSSTYTLPLGQSSANQNRINFQQLSSAIQSGNLTAAQQAYSQIQSSMGANGGGSGSSAQGNPFQQLMSQVGTALQSGNLSSAQQTLNTFQQQAASGAGGHHHHHHGGSAGTAASSATPASSSNPTDSSSSAVTSIDLTA